MTETLNEKVTETVTETVNEKVTETAEQFDPNDPKNWPKLKPGERYSEFKDWRGLPIVQKCPFEETQDKDFDPNDKKNWPKLRPGDKYSEFKDWRGIPIVQRGPISLHYVALPTLHQFLIAIGECITLDLKDDPEAESGIRSRYKDFLKEAIANENDCLAKDWKDKFLGENTVLEIDEVYDSFRIMKRDDVNTDYHTITSYDKFRFEFVDYEGMLEEAQGKAEEEKSNIINF